MKPRIAIVLVLSWVISALPARADMIEIKGRGVLNGKILSQDDKEVHFEDSAKNLFVVPKADVLFLEAQTDAPVTAQKAFKKGSSKHGWKPDVTEWRDRAEHYFYVTKRFVMDKTKGVRDFITAPLDRSEADVKAKELADSMGELSTHLKTANKQERKRGAQLRGIKEDQMRSSIKTKSKSKNNASGNFSSLD